MDNRNHRPGRGSTVFWIVDFYYMQIKERTISPQKSERHAIMALAKSEGALRLSNQVAVSTTTNRITTGGYGYDANGNMTNDGQNTLTYDAENHLLTSGGTLGSGTYTYDGNGLRVKKVSGSTTTVYSFSGSKVIAEYINGAAASSPTREYIYSGSALIAKIEGTATQYYHADHLSARLMTDSGGNKIGEQGHFPYGETWYPATPATKWEFTTYERDSESGNDYAMARYHVNRLGRFSSPDQLAGSAGNPQSLNKYAYVHNDPVNLVDPSGMVSCWWPDYCGGEDPGGGDGGGCLLGSCNEDPPSGGHPDTCGTFCGPPGDFGFPASPQTNGFVATGPGIDWLNVLFGPPQGAIINNWHLDPITGARVPDDGDPSDPSCTENSDSASNCTYWNQAPGLWLPTKPPTPEQKRLKELAKQVARQAGPIANPCGIAEFYGLSVVGGTIGGAAAGGEVATQGAEALTTYWPQILQRGYSWVYRQLARGAPLLPFMGNFPKNVTDAKDKISSACKAME
jgi:RHS repeat-associated protein